MLCMHPQTQFGDEGNAVWGRGKENLRNACKKLLARHARKELADELLP